MKRKKQKLTNNPAHKPKAKANKSPQAKGPLVPTSIVEVDCIVADIALVNGAEAAEVTRPTLFIYKGKTSGLIVGLSVQPGMKWIDGRNKAHV